MSQDAGARSGILGIFGNFKDLLGLGKTPNGQVLIDSDPTSPSPLPSHETTPQPEVQSSHIANRPITPPHPQTRRPRQTPVASNPDEEFVDAGRDFELGTDEEVLVERVPIDERGKTPEPEATAAMAHDMPKASTKRNKKIGGGVGPINTMDRDNQAKPAWMNHGKVKTLQTRPPHTSNPPYRSPAKRRAETPPQREEERPASSYRTAQTSQSSPDWLIPHPKRRKTNPVANGQISARSSGDVPGEVKAQPVQRARRREEFHDGLNGQSSSFRNMEAMLRPSRTSTNGSKNSSRAGSEGRKSHAQQVKSHHFGTKEVHTTTKLDDDDEPMQDNEDVNVKAVHSTRTGPFSGANRESIAQARAMATDTGQLIRNKTIGSSTSLALRGPKSSNRPTRDGRVRDVPKADGLVDSDDPVRSSDSDELGVDGSDKEGMASTRVPPHQESNHVHNPSRKLDRTLASSQASADDIADPPSGLRHQLIRDDSRRDSRDQSDPLQADATADPLALLVNHTTTPTRKQNPSRIGEVLPERKSARQKLSIGDGFDDDEMPQGKTKHGLRKSKKQREREATAAASTEVKMPAKVYHAKYLYDCGVEFEGSSEIRKVNQMCRFEYATAVNKHGTIEPTKINKVLWGENSHVRLSGVAHKGKVYEVRIEFENIDDFQDFKADCTRFGLKTDKGWSNSSDEQLAKIFKRPLLYDREASDMDKTRQEDRMEAPRSRVAAGSQANTSKSRTTRSTTSYSQAGPSRDITPKPKLPYSRTGALGSRWKQSLVYPPGGARNNVATVDFDDLQRLDEDEFLNDNLVSFGLRRAFEKTSQEVRDKVHIFNTYFYTAMTKDPNQYGINHDAVKKWTLKLANKRGLFEHDYIIVPINESYHWHVAIICNVRKIDLRPSADDDTTSSRPQTADHTSPPSTRQTRQRDVHAEVSASSPPPTRDIEHKTSQLSLSENANDEGKTKTVNQSNKNDMIDSLVNDDDASKGPATPGKSFTRPKSKSKDPSDPIIITLDSFGGAHRDVVRDLKEYIRHEAVDKLNTQPASASLPGSLTAKNIPLQSNFSDCGLYLIAYVEHFLKDPEGFVTRVVEKKMNREEHWADFDAATLRDRFRDIVVGEGKRQNGFILTAAEEAAVNKTNMTPHVRATTPQMDSSVLQEQDTHTDGPEVRQASPQPSQPQPSAAKSISEERYGNSDDDQLPSWNGFTSRYSAGVQDRYSEKQDQPQKHVPKQQNRKRRSNSPHQPDESVGDLLPGIENYQHAAHDAGTTDDADDDMLETSYEPERVALGHDRYEEVPSDPILKKLSRGFPDLLQQSRPRIEETLQDYYQTKGQKSGKAYRMSPELGYRQDA